jgi:hypothetical protein
MSWDEDGLFNGIGKVLVSVELGTVAMPWLVDALEGKVVDSVQSVLDLENAMPRGSRGTIEPSTSMARGLLTLKMFHPE